MFKEKEAWMFVVVSLLVVVFGFSALTGLNPTITGAVTGLMEDLGFFAVGDEDTTKWNVSRDFSLGEDTAYGVAIDSNDNLFVVGVGNVSGGKTGGDSIVKKFLANGTENATNWNHTFHGFGASNDTILYDVAVDSQNSVYVVGMISDGVGDGTSSDWLIKKYYSNGTEDIANWNKTFDSSAFIGTADGQDEAKAIVVDANDNVYVGGYFNVIFTANFLVVKKFDSSGNENLTRWNKSFPGGANAGATLEGLALDSSNNLYVAGNIGSGNGISVNWWLKKIYANGTEDVTNWNKTYGYAGAPNEHDSSVKEVGVDSNNNAYFVGYTNVTRPSVYRWFIKKFNSTGSEDGPNWNKTFSVGDQEDNRAWDIAIDSLDNVYVVGEARNSTYWWVKSFNASGIENVTAWNKTVTQAAKGQAIAYSVALDSKDNVTVVGIFNGSVASNTGSDWLIKKYEGFLAPNRPPRWQANISSLVTAYNKSIRSLFNISWADETNTTSSIFESNYSGVPTNYTMNILTRLVNNGTNVTYNYSAVLSAGHHYWKVYGNDSGNNRNETSSFVFNIPKATPTLNLSLNGTRSNLSIQTALSIFLNCSFETGDPSGKVSLYLNSTRYKAEAVTMGNITSFASQAHYNVTCAYNTTQNFSSYQINYLVNATLVDSDGDGTPDAGDRIQGNATSVTSSGVTGLNITLAGVALGKGNTTTGAQQLAFKDGNKLLLNFTFNFSANVFNFSLVNLVVDTDSVVINLSGLASGVTYNKTIYLDDNGYTSLCVKDAEIASVTGISSGCTDTNEFDLSACIGVSTGTAVSGILCYDEGTRFKLSNLNHTGVRGSTGGGGNNNLGTPGGGSSGGSSGGTDFVDYEERPIGEREKAPESKEDKDGITGGVVVEETQEERREPLVGQATSLGFVDILKDYSILWIVSVMVFVVGIISIFFLVKRRR